MSLIQKQNAQISKNENKKLAPTQDLPLNNTS